MLSRDQSIELATDHGYQHQLMNSMELRHFPEAASLAAIQERHNILLYQKMQCRVHKGAPLVLVPTTSYLFKIWGFHGGDYEECRLLGCYAVWLL
jgi:hypothetical protein